MPFYDFECSKMHKQELRMTFDEHSKLDSDAQGPYIDCNVKYGDLEHPKCEEKAYQVYSTFRFNVT